MPIIFCSFAGVIISSESNHADNRVSKMSLSRDRYEAACHVHLDLLIHHRGVVLRGQQSQPHAQHVSGSEAIHCKCKGLMSPFGLLTADICEHFLNVCSMGRFKLGSSHQLAVIYPQPLIQGLGVEKAIAREPRGRCAVSLLISAIKRCPFSEATIRRDHHFVFLDAHPNIRGGRTIVVHHIDQRNQTKVGRLPSPFHKDGESSALGHGVSPDNLFQT